MAPAVRRRKNTLSIDDAAEQSASRLHDQTAQYKARKRLESAVQRWKGKFTAAMGAAAAVVNGLKARTQASGSQLLDAMRAKETDTTPWTVVIAPMCCPLMMHRADRTLYGLPYGYAELGAV